MSDKSYISPLQRSAHVPPTTSSPLPGYNPNQRSRSNRETEKQLYAQISKQFNHTYESTVTFFNTPISFDEPSSALPTTTHPLGSKHEKGAEEIKVAPRTEESFPKTSIPKYLPGPEHPLNHLTSYIIVQPKAHPNWESKTQLWTHTSATKLINDFQTHRKNFCRPIPVLDNTIYQGLDKGFEWYFIDDIEVILPGSEELKLMLEAKEAMKSYGDNGRTFSAWKESLLSTWIKINLEKIPTTWSGFDRLRDPMTLNGGIDSEVPKYLLEIGGLKDEIVILESMK